MIAPWFDRALDVMLAALLIALLWIVATPPPPAAEPDGCYTDAECEECGNDPDCLEWFRTSQP